MSRSLHPQHILGQAEIVVTKTGLDLFWNNGGASQAVCACIGPEAEPVSFGNAVDRVSSNQNFLTRRNPPEVSASLPRLAFNGEMSNTHQRNDSMARIDAVTVTAGNGGAPGLRIYSSTQATDTLLQEIPLVEDTESALTFKANELTINSNDGRRIVVVVNGSAGSGTLDACDLRVKGNWGDRGEVLTDRNKL